MRVWVGGWNTRDAEACVQAFEDIHQAVVRRILAPYLLDYSFIQRWSSAYREAHHNTVESLAILAQEDEKTSYVNTTYWQSHIVIPWGLWFLGEWGEALREIKSAIIMLEKNGDDRAAQMLRLYQAWIHLHAMDFDGVRSICDSVFPWLADPSAISMLRICQVIAGTAETALGSYARARDYLVTVRDDMDRHMVIRDWYWRMPLELALTDLWLAQGNLPQAHSQAEQLLRTTLTTAERTWQALACEVNARVAMAMHHISHAQACIAQALSIMEGFEVPMAAWHVHATAAALYHDTGNSTLSDHHRATSRAIIVRLSNSLEVRDPLRMTFLSAPSVRAIFGGSEYSISETRERIQYEV